MSRVPSCIHALAKRCSALTLVLAAAWGGAAQAYQNGGYFVYQGGGGAPVAAVATPFPANLYRDMVAVTFPVNADAGVRALLAPGFDPAHQTPQARLLAQHHNRTFLYLPRTAYDLAYYVYRRGAGGVPPALGASDSMMYYAWHNGQGGPQILGAPANLPSYYRDLVNAAGLKMELENFNTWMIGQINAWVASAAAAGPPGPGAAPGGHRLPWGAPAPVFVGGGWGAQNAVLRFNHATLGNVVTALTNAAAGMGLANPAWPANAAPRIAQLAALEDNNDGNTYITRGAPGAGGPNGANNPLTIQLTPAPNYLPVWAGGVVGTPTYTAHPHTFSMSFSSGILSACLPVPGGDQHACTLGRLNAAPGAGQVFATPVNIANYRNNNGWVRVLSIPPVPPLAANLQHMQELWHPRTKIFVTGGPPAVLNGQVDGIADYGLPHNFNNNWTALGWLLLPVANENAAMALATPAQGAIMQSTTLQ